MDISWIDPARPAVADVTGAVAVQEAARIVDSPHQLTCVTSDFVAGLRHGWDGEPAQTAVARNAEGTVIAVFGVDLPRRDNTHLGGVFVTVDPQWRRRGVGTRLFSIGVERIREAGRTLVVANTWDGSAGVPFAKSVGLDRVSEDAQRRQDLRSADADRIAGIAADARKHAGEYELLRLPGAVPEDLLDAVVTLTDAINDAPTDDLDVEDEVFSPERLRAFEDAQQAYDRRIYRLVARHRTGGELAGHTLVAVSAQQPWQAWQLDTSVVRAHRGHRLGLLLKAEMIGWLRQVEPHLHRLDTWNAVSNKHMIEINEQLGYRVIAGNVGWQRHL
jgi:GNAT superfamily N-acetyltransferase